MQSLLLTVFMGGEMMWIEGLYGDIIGFLSSKFFGKSTLRDQGSNL